MSTDYQITAYVESEFESQFIAGGMVHAYAQYAAGEDYRCTVVDTITPGIVHVAMSVCVDTLPAAVALTERVAYVAGVAHVRLRSETGDVEMSIER